MWIRGLNALHKPLLHPLPSQFAAAVRDRPLHSGEDHRVVSLECVEELQEDRNAGEAGVADVDGEPPYVEEPALVRPAPVRVGLEVGVLQVEDADVGGDRGEPVGEDRLGAVERLVEGVADVQDVADRHGSVAGVGGKPLRFCDRRGDLARQGRRLHEQRVRPSARACSARASRLSTSSW